MRTGEDRWFFGLVLILSLPFFALGVAGNSLPFAPALPLSALMAIVLMIAALSLIIRETGLKTLFSKNNILISIGACAPLLPA